MSLKTKQQGFTIVELLIVIVVIGILAALVITTFTGIQKKARDTERTTDIKAIHGQLEAFQAQYVYYPTLDELNDVTNNGWRATQLKGLDNDAFIDPKNSAGSNQMAAAPASGVYSYVPSPAGCDNDQDNGTMCTSYILTATLESGDEFIKNSLD